MKYDYISILAGGRCAFACPFCIGQNVVEDKDPHYSDNWKKFLELYAHETQLLSLSGSTSDPCFLGTELNKEMVTYARMCNRKIKVSMHTRSISPFTKEAYIYCDKVVISVDEENMLNVKSFISTLSEQEKLKTRLSVVTTIHNKNLIKDKEFYTQFDGIKQFTIRQDVFEEEIDFKLDWCNFTDYRDNGSIFYTDLKNDITVAYWNYKRINPNLNTIYLWSDGKVTGQDEWDKLH